MSKKLSFKKRVLSVISLKDVIGTNRPEDRVAKPSVKRSQEVGTDHSTSEFTFSNNFYSENEVSSHLAIGRSLSDFLPGLGQGQLVGRQAVGAVSKGSLELTLSLGPTTSLEVEVIRAKSLLSYGRAQMCYVKLSLVRGNQCVEKHRTSSVAVKSSNPDFHQRFVFRQTHKDCILQMSVWSEKKQWLGAAQILLDELPLRSGQVCSWYLLVSREALLSHWLKPQLFDEDNRDVTDDRCSLWEFNGSCQNTGENMSRRASCTSQRPLAVTSWECSRRSSSDQVSTVTNTNSEQESLAETRVPYM